MTVNIGPGTESSRNLPANDNLAGRVATDRLIDKLQIAGDDYSDATLNVIRTQLAQAYALNYLPQSQAEAFQPSAMDIAWLHWSVFAQYNLPPQTFGGTPFGGAYALIFGTIGSRYAPPFWCTGCKP